MITLKFDRHLSSSGAKVFSEIVFLSGFIFSEDATFNEIILKCLPSKYTPSESKAITCETHSYVTNKLCQTWKNTLRAVHAVEWTRLNLQYFWSFIAKTWLNDLEDIGQDQKSLHTMNLLMLVMICAKYGKNPFRIVCVNRILGRNLHLDWLRSYRLNFNCLGVWVIEETTPSDHQSQLCVGMRWWLLKGMDIEGSKVALNLDWMAGNSRHCNGHEYQGSI